MYDKNIMELEKHFNTVMSWISSLFDYHDKEVCGLPWGEYYRKYSKTAYNKKEVNELVNKLMEDPCVHNKKGIFEYILSGCEKPELLEIRIFFLFVFFSLFLSILKIVKPLFQDLLFSSTIELTIIFL